MEIFWNKIYLDHPPYRSWDISVKEYDPRQFLKLIDKILIDFKTLTILNKEAALLSRLIYRMKSKFRNDKGFKYMEKVNRALLNYFNMSLEKEYKILKKYIGISNGMVSLPSRQIIEYILVRTQGFAKLMCHTELTAMAAGNILKSRLHIGQSWSVAMIAYAIISRIWVVSRYIVRNLCQWYNDIYNLTKIFKIVGIPWLPENYVLPENLSEWLNVAWLNKDTETLPIKGNRKKSIFNLLEINNTDEENVAIIDDLFIDSSKSEVPKSNMSQNELIIKQDDDIGKPISRTNFTKMNCKFVKDRMNEENTKISKKKRKIKRLKETK